MADKLEEAFIKKETAEKDLGQTILTLVKELYRLMGKPVYQVLPPETEAKIKGGG